VPETGHVEAQGTVPALRMLSLLSEAENKIPTGQGAGRALGGGATVPRLPVPAWDKGLVSLCPRAPKRGVVAGSKS
jgi:hypothetical protein